MCYGRTDALTTVWIYIYSHAVLVTYGRVRFPKDWLDFPDPNKRAPKFGTAYSPELGRKMCHHLTTPLLTAASINRITNCTATIMALNLALHKRVLIQGIIDSKL